jgi:hypothetical protein
MYFIPLTPPKHRGDRLRGDSHPPPDSLLWRSAVKTSRRFFSLTLAGDLYDEGALWSIDANREACGFTVSRQL